MKKHILGSIGKKMKLIKRSSTFYDFKTQLSFWDKNKTQLVLNPALERTIVETSTVENSDPDEFAISGPTKLTETIENSDVDEFSLNFSGTKETRTIEDTDIDSIIAISSRITKTIEESDVDGCVATPPPTTKNTFVVEDSDADEYSMA